MIFAHFGVPGIVPNIDPANSEPGTTYYLLAYTLSAAAMDACIQIYIVLILQTDECKGVSDLFIPSEGMHTVIIIIFVLNNTVNTCDCCAAHNTTYVFCRRRQAAGIVQHLLAFRPAVSDGLVLPAEVGFFMAGVEPRRKRYHSAVEDHRTNRRMETSKVGQKWPVLNISSIAAWRHAKSSRFVHARSPVRGEMVKVEHHFQFCTVVDGVV